jgi:uncharacterized protein involved in exopolysaccharide biosynthesis
MFVFLLLGGGYAILSNDQYTSSAKVLRETQEGNLPMSGGGLSMLQGLGANIGISSGGGLRPEAFPEVLRSREVRLEVVRDTFYFSSIDRSMTYADYINRTPGLIGIIRDYTIGVPKIIDRQLSSDTVRMGDRMRRAAYPTEEEEQAIEQIRNRVATAVSTESGIMSISVTMQDPALAAEMTKSFLDALSERIGEIRTVEARRNLRFVEKRFGEVEKELEAAESQLASFLERNQQISNAELQFQQDRLQRQVRFKEQLYSELQKQLTQARLDLQRQQPVVTVLERPVPPMKPSAPNRVLIVGVSLFLGLFLGTGIASIRAFVATQESSSDQRQKIDELRSRLRSVMDWVQISRWLPAKNRREERSGASKHKQEPHESTSPTRSEE